MADSAAHIVPEPAFPVATRTRGQREYEVLFPGQPCYYCGDAPNSVDHKIPSSRGGQRGDNLVPACFRCNQMKGNLTVEEFVAHMQRILQMLDSKKNVIQFGDRSVIQFPIAA